MRLGKESTKPSEKKIVKAYKKAVIVIQVAAVTGEGESEAAFKGEIAKVIENFRVGILENL